MKRIGNLLLVSSLSLAFGVKSVSAQTFNDGDAHSLSRGNYITINSLDVGSANYGIYKYTFDNGKYVGYCEDPQNFSGKNIQYPENSEQQLMVKQFKIWMQVY